MRQISNDGSQLLNASPHPFHVVSVIECQLTVIANMFFGFQNRQRKIYAISIRRFSVGILMIHDIKYITNNFTWSQLRTSLYIQCDSIGDKPLP